MYCFPMAARSKVQNMTARSMHLQSILFACGLGLAPVPMLFAAGPTRAATLAYDTYIGGIESRLAQQHRSSSSFLIPEPDRESRLRQGGPVLDRVTPGGTIALPGAMLHHWRGTAFVAGATTGQLEQLLKDFNAYPRHFAPQVLETQVLAANGDHIEASMRVRQKHVITVVLDSTYDVTFGRLDARHGYSRSQSTRIAEIESPGTPGERVLRADEEHGFLWRLNTYWSYEERDGGLYMQIESVSLTRSIPVGLGWAVRPFVESVPRESLEFTLRSVCDALRK